MSFIFVFLCFLHIFVIILMICTDPYTGSAVGEGTEYMAVLVDDSRSLQLPQDNSGGLQQPRPWNTLRISQHRFLIADDFINVLVPFLQTWDGHSII